MSPNEGGFLRPTWNLWMDPRRLRTVILTTKARLSSSGLLLCADVQLSFCASLTEWCIRIPSGELHITIKAYKAEQKDEISLELGETIEVIHKLLDGWWVVRYKKFNLSDSERNGY